MSQCQCSLCLLGIKYGFIRFFKSLHCFNLCFTQHINLYRILFVQLNCEIIVLSYVTGMKKAAFIIVYRIYSSSSVQDNLLPDSSAKLAGFSEYNFSQTKTSVLCTSMMRFSLFLSSNARTCTGSIHKTYTKAWRMYVYIHSLTHRVLS